ncbi:hypothetical protein GGI20_003478 [Coemansia sp. BCRC 34301]|nr:hypothetical protein GGI20_003478 [Coemansia sp. BCRC 34301]
MRLCCIAILNRQDMPVYLRTFDTPGAKESDTEYECLAHTSCDVIEERMSKSSDAYLGLLQTAGDVAVYGYVSNTGIRIMVMLRVQEPVVRDTAVRELLLIVHRAYVVRMCNPFSDQENESPRFEAVVGELARLHSN